VAAVIGPQKRDDGSQPEAAVQDDPAAARSWPKPGLATVGYSTAKLTFGAAP